MSTGQSHRFAYAKAGYAAKASLFNALDPTSAVTVETLTFWDRWWAPKYRRATFLVEIDEQPIALGSDGEWRWFIPPGRYRVAPDIHPACSHPVELALHRQGQNGVLQSGRALCRS